LKYPVRDRCPNRSLTARLAGLMVAVACGLPGSLVAEDLAVLEQTAMKDAVARAEPSVVRIETFGGLQQRGQLSTTSAPTTGVVVTGDGYIVSSAFAFVHQPEGIVVTTHDNRTFPAELIARDRSRMIVLLKVNEPYDWPVPAESPPSELQVGQWAMALGRTYGSSSAGASVGIVSALNRIWGTAIQTDAKVSPANYGGPLIDIVGRAIGVLVPLSPERHSEIAGAEWYDGGIGFCIPWGDVLSSVERLRNGEDLFPGLLGITFKSTDLFASRVRLSTVIPNSPAAKAGLQPGDEITAADGRTVTRQAQLKYVLGPKYAGDTIQLRVLREGEVIEAETELAREIEPYEAPFLGILPVRFDGDETDGVTIKHVYSDSPAAGAGIQPGDRLLKCNGEALDTIVAWQGALVRWQPGDEIQIEVSHQGNPRSLPIVLSTLPESIPADVNTPPKMEADEWQQIEITIPAAPNECVALVPSGDAPPGGYGLAVWLPPPELAASKDSLAIWEPYCQQYGVILLCPRPMDTKKWSLSELEFIEKSISHVRRNYEIDPARMVVHGYQSGGTLAYLLAMKSPQNVRGLAIVDATMMRGVTFRRNDPAYPLAFFIAADHTSRLVDRVNQDVERMRELKYPVTFRSLGPLVGFPTESIASDISRWMDTLDRF